MLLLAVFLQFLLLLGSGHGFLSETSDVWSLDRCDVALEDWAGEALRALKKQQHVNAHELKELMFFLHVPRTGGRTFHQCLLRHLYPQEDHCQRSYDELRFNASTHCRLLVTHDDFSVLGKLPVDSTSVIINMRHPVDRVFSAYEFSVEVASRFLGRSKKGSRVAGPAKKPGWSSTLEIWPWSFLVPWMKEDIIRRQSLRQQGEEDALSPGVSDISNYNASAYLMPLHEFLKQPIVMDLVQNGATLQVAGLTNNSYTREAGDLRRCVSSYPPLGYHVLNVAKRRLDRMLFVGLTDKHEDTAKLFARLVGGQLFPLGGPSNLPAHAKFAEAGFAKPEGLAEFGLVKSSDLLKKRIQATKSTFQARHPMIPKSQNLTVYGLIDIYKHCATRLQSTQVQRRINSLKNALPVNFSTESRRLVAEEILDDIRERNFLDLDLYAYAQQLFSKTNAQGFETPTAVAIDAETTFLDSMLNGGLDLPSSHSWKLMFMVLMFVCTILMTLGAWMVVSSKRNKNLRFRGHNHHEKI